MKRPALPGNAAVLNNVLFRIITPLDAGQTSSSCSPCLKPFFEFQRVTIQSSNPVFFLDGNTRWEASSCRRAQVLLFFFLRSGYSFVGRDWNVFKVQDPNKHLSESTRFTSRLPKKTDFAHKSTAHLARAGAQYKEQERQIMCNPLTTVKPTHQLWKATSQSC